MRRTRFAVEEQRAAEAEAAVLVKPPELAAAVKQRQAWTLQASQRQQQPEQPAGSEPPEARAPVLKQPILAR
jgi:hypothetical protein